MSMGPSGREPSRVQTSARLKQWRGTSLDRHVLLRAFIDVEQTDHAFHMA